MLLEATATARAFQCLLRSLDAKLVAGAFKVRVCNGRNPKVKHRQTLSDISGTRDSASRVVMRGRQMRSFSKDVR
eukprot:4910814-Amphidinium_carterae.1